MVIMLGTMLLTPLHVRPNAGQDQAACICPLQSCFADTVRAPALCVVFMPWHIGIA